MSWRAFAIPARRRQLLSELLDSLRPWSSEIHMVLLDSRYRLDPVAERCGAVR